MKITEQQVKDCYDNKELLKKYFPDVFNPNLEAGKWYKSNDVEKHIFCVLSSTESEYFFYGFNLGGTYRERDYYSFIAYVFKNGFSLAKEEEVEKAIIAEAEKRGFEDGIKYISPNGAFTRIIKTPFYLSDGMDSLCCKNGDMIMYKGKWAEIIQETEIELTLDQIAEKFGVDKVKIKKE